MIYLDALGSAKTVQESSCNNFFCLILNSCKPKLQGQLADLSHETREGVMAGPLRVRAFPRRLALPPHHAHNIAG